MSFFTNSQQHSSVRSYLLRVCILTVFLGLMICLFNYWSNPYRLFRTNTDEVLSAKKPRPEKYQQKIKSEIAKKLPSDILILGNSTLEIGVDPDDPKLKPLKASIYNHAIAGHNLHDVSAGLDDILSVWKPKHVLLNVSLADYIFSEEIRKKRTAVAPESNLKVNALFSIDAVLDSFRSWLIPFMTDAQTITARGHNPMNNVEASAKRNGYKQLFDVANSRISQMMEKYRSGNGLASKDKSVSLQDYSDLLRKLEVAKVPTTVIISPLHQDYQRNLRSFQLLETQKQWKEAIIDLTRQSNSSTQIRLIDYGCSAIWLSESIPKRNDKNSKMAFYWDSEHFKSIVGTQIILDLFQNQDNQLTAASPTHGVDLLSSDIAEQHIKCDQISQIKLEN
jgi:hypothetical protein